MLPQGIDHMVMLEPGYNRLLMSYHNAGMTLTQSWSTANSLDTKVEIEDKMAKGLKGEILTNYLPHSKAYGAKGNLYFKQPNFHGRAFVDFFKGPTATIDAVLGHEGYLVGAEAGYDVQKASITRYSAAVGYVAPQYAAAITATNNLNIFSASYYHKVNSEVEAGAKATWDSKAGNNVGLEVASKYRLDPTSFAKVSDLAIYMYTTINAVLLYLCMKVGRGGHSSLYQCIAHDVCAKPYIRLRSTTAALHPWPIMFFFDRASHWESVLLSIPRS